ncbi:MAG TPA: hypothetical protein DCG48_02915 [Rhodospirillaceae bacterium]|nr:hypothetical protein [Rhodospirillaceae bacterium]
MKRKSPIRTLLLVFVMLAVTFGLLAYIADPTPPKPKEQADPVDRRPLAEVLARMSEDKIKDPMMAGASIAGQVKKMQAADAEPDFLLGPFSIGMSYDNALGATTGFNKILAVDDGVMIVYNVLPDRFNAFFRTHQHDAPAFRISYHRSLEQRTEAEMLGHLRAIWGEETESECNDRVEQPGRVCSLTWWPVNGVRLVAVVTITDHNADGVTDIDLQVDAYDDQAETRDR